MNRMKIGAAGLAVALTALIVPATVQAADNTTIVEGAAAPAIYVSYADLNLASEAGVDRLNRRVRFAAARLCNEPGLTPVVQKMQDRACRDEAIESAERQIALAVANFGNSQFAAAASRGIEVALR